MDEEGKRVKAKLCYLYTFSSCRPDANSANANADCASLSASFSRFIMINGSSHTQHPIHDSHAHSDLIMRVLHIHLATVANCFFFPVRCKTYQCLASKMSLPH